MTPDPWAELSPPYSTIAADPPWRYDEGWPPFADKAGDTRERSALPYSGMDLAAIAAHNAATRSRLTRRDADATWRDVARTNQASLDARMSAQEAGWAVRRNHGGRDLCPAHRIEAAA